VKKGVVMLNDNDLPLPEDAESCLGLERDEQLYDYYNGVLVGDAAREFEAHLLDCFTCRRKVATLDLINETLKSELLPARDEPPTSEEINAPESAQESATTKVMERGTPPHYVILGGLGVLSVLGVGVVKLFKYARQS
jgi:anti-sigma factor RsiW